MLRRLEWKALLTELPWEICRRVLSFQAQPSPHLPAAAPFPPPEAEGAEGAEGAGGTGGAEGPGGAEGAGQVLGRGSAPKSTVNASTRLRVARRGHLWSLEPEPRNQASVFTEVFAEV